MKHSRWPDTVHDRVVAALISARNHLNRHNASGAHVTGDAFLQELNELIRRLDPYKPPPDWYSRPGECSAKISEADRIAVARSYAAERESQLHAIREELETGHRSRLQLREELDKLRSEFDRICEQLERETRGRVTLDDDDDDDDAAESIGSNLPIWGVIRGRYRDRATLLPFRSTRRESAEIHRATLERVMPSTDYAGVGSTRPRYEVVALHPGVVWPDTEIQAELLPGDCWGPIADE